MPAACSPGARFAVARRPPVASAGFWIFDDSLVALETPIASIEVTRPQEIDLYTRMFEHLKASAFYGAAARVDGR